MNLKNVLTEPHDIPKTPMDKALEFYKFVIEVERAKEPDIQKFYEYSLYYRSDGLILIDMPCNKTFYEIFKSNFSEKFPKDLYVGLRIKYGDEMLNLLGFTIDYTDIKDYNPDDELLPVLVESFEVNRKVAFDIELSEQQILEINHGFHNGMTMDDIKELLEKNIGEKVIIIEKIYLALSTKAIDLAQLYSEFNSKRWHRTACSSELLRALLTHEEVKNFKMQELSEDTILRITELDGYQAQAVVMALTNQVSLISGPPGTGKTQVILNILANALALGKTAVIASKNNKAVDNVKNRFDMIDSYGYLLRLGSKSQIGTVSVPSMIELISSAKRLSESGKPDENIIIK